MTREITLQKVNKHIQNVGERWGFEFECRDEHVVVAPKEEFDAFVRIVLDDKTEWNYMDGAVVVKHNIVAKVSIKRMGDVLEPKAMRKVLDEIDYATTVCEIINEDLEDVSVTDVITWNKNN